MGAIVAILEAQGLVDRAADTNDGRQSIVTVTGTGTGRRSLDQARAVKQDWLTERLTHELDQHEQAILAQAVPLLQRIVDFTSENSPSGSLGEVGAAESADPVGGDGAGGRSARLETMPGFRRETSQKRPERPDQ
jgi:hypothetical protein